MILYPNAKINIGLKVLNKRPDGYHNISSVFYPIALSDILEFIPTSVNEFEFSQTGIQIDGNPDDNLCVKVYHFFRKEFDIPILKIHLHKNIPTQAGLGGGSSDAAFFIKGINKYFNLDLTINKMKEIALQFGSDCPFFIENKPSKVSGRGEVLQLFQLDLSMYHIIIVKPQISISTAMAYSSIIPDAYPIDFSVLLEQPIDSWEGKVENDFETFAFAKFTELKKIKNKLLQHGAIFSQMTGSGSAIYGIFTKQIEIPQNLFPESKIFNEPSQGTGHFHKKSYLG